MDVVIVLCMVMCGFVDLFDLDDLCVGIDLVMCVGVFGGGSGVVVLVLVLVSGKVGMVVIVDDDGNLLL